MNFIQLILKQMRQRALSTWLTLLSVMLGVGLAIAIMVFQREGEKLFGQSDFGYDLIVGPKGSPLQLVLNTVYNIDQSPGNIPYKIYQDLARPNHLMVRSAVPFAVGDTYENFRVIGTLPHVFPIDHEGNEITPGKDPTLSKVFQYRADKRFSFREGRPFHPQKFEAVIGHQVFKSGKLKLGEKFKVSHGAGDKRSKDDVHDEQWTVVGVLDETQTSMDKVIFIPLISFYAIPQHKDAMDAFEALKQMQEARERQQAGLPPLPATTPGPAASATPADATKVNPAPAAADAPGKKEEHDDHDHEHDHDHAPATKPATQPAHDEHDDDHEHEKSQAPATRPDAHAHEDEHEEHGEHDDHDHHDHAYHLNPDGTIELHLPQDQWMLSAIPVRTRGPFQTMTLMWGFANDPQARATAVSPAMEMRKFYDTFLEGSSWLLLFISLLVTIVAAVSILVSIYNSVSARLKEIAILRALGATRTRVLLLICIEAGLIGLIGGLLGLILGHLLSAAGSAFLRQLLGEGINWLFVSRWEWIYLGVVTFLAVLAGLVPALKAYRTPVATNLVAG